MDRPGDGALYYTVATFPVSIEQIVWAVLAGLLIGLAAAAFCWLISAVQTHRLAGRGLLAGPLAVFPALGSLAIPFPQPLGNGKDIAQHTFSATWPLSLLASLFVLKPIITAACFGSGASGGLFTPTTSYGALLGALLGQLWTSYVWPGAPIASYAFIGATAMLAAGMQAPVSAFVLLTDPSHSNLTLLVPMALAAIGASLVVRALGVRSTYPARLSEDDRHHVVQLGRFGAHRRGHGGDGRRAADRSARRQQDEMGSFARTWDPQDMHIDAVQAEASPSGGLIASGFQTLGVAWWLFLRLGGWCRMSLNGG